MKVLFSPRSIRQKLLLIMMLMALLSSSITAGIILYYEKGKEITALRDKVELISSVISPSLTAAVAFNDMDTVDELIAPTVHTDGIVSIYVYDDQGVLTEVHKPDRSEYEAEDSFQFSTPLRLDNKEYGRLVIHADDAVVQDKIFFYQIFVVQILIATLLLSLFLSIFLSRFLTKPLLKLIQAARDITSSNNYKIRVAQQGKDEIGDLTDCFNVMLEAIDHRDRVLESEVIARTKDLELANSRLHLQAHEDALSGLPNRRALYSFLNSRIHSRDVFALLFIDLDGFKRVNDTLGHDQGDLLLKEASNRIQESVRHTDFVARLGGDEFTVVLPTLIDTDSVDRIAGTILKRLSEPFILDGEEVYVTGSIGITLYPHDADSVDALVKQADQAMYESKRLGKNCCSYFNSAMQQRLNEKKLLIDDLREGVKSNQFVLFYQPIMDLQTEKIVKAEALIRWRHPRNGLLYPDEFLPTVEEEGFMDELGFWTANQATQDAIRWMHSADASIQVSINLSPTQFKEDGLLNEWLNSLSGLNFNVQNLVVEITEHSLIENSKYVKETLASIRAKGIGIAVDDFGVGYSSLSYLQQLQLDILKIDRSFVSSLTTSDNSYALCKAIIMIAHELGLKVVAEGIETEEQKAMLTEVGCDYGQGYLFSKPLPVDQFESKYLKSECLHYQVDLM